MQIDKLLEILPVHLKAMTQCYLFKDAIKVIQIFQEKDQRFYAEYLQKFEPMRIKSGTVFAEEGSLADEVFFLLTGCVKRESEEETALQMQPNFLVEGVIFGEADLILK